MKTRFTLTQAFVGVLAALALLLGSSFIILVQRSRASILGASQTLQFAAAQRAAGVVEDWLRQAEHAVDDIDRLIRAGACVPERQDTLAACVSAELAGSPDLAEVTFTRPDGTQTSALRTDAGLCARRTTSVDGRFVAELRCGGQMRRDPVPDPAQHLSFTTPVELSGRTLWSDLSYTELDARMPTAERRVVVNVLRGLSAPAGGVLGVVRVSLLERELDRRLAMFRVHETDPADPFRMFLCDEQGRLVTRLDARDRLQVQNDDLRIEPASLPPAIARALADPALAKLDDQSPFALRVLDVDGQRYVAAFRALERTQGWRVAIVGPESYYLSDLRAMQRKMAIGGAVVSLLFVLSGAWLLRALRRGLARIQDETARMRSFAFAPSQARTGFRDIAEVLASLEQAKTALRALGRYAPMDLVRQLYQANRDPVLGGELRELTLLFTDIAGFTSIVETLPPDQLAQLLGLYFETMTGAIEASGGTVDKYIGDAVMAMWNAPQRSEQHPVQACRAALACVEATARLAASPAWDKLPHLATRFGLHTAEVLVGHFGAPTRMSYTAFGDGVNLAARLEALNKQYGTTLLASASVQERARHQFEFRQLDRVAVKGKSRAVDVFELLGPQGMSGARVETARAYEQALRAYFAGDFAAAIERLLPLADDPPSAVLLERCRALAVDPPSLPWDGVYVATSK